MRQGSAPSTASTGTREKGQNEFDDKGSFILLRRIWYWATLSSIPILKAMNYPVNSSLGGRGGWKNRGAGGRDTGGRASGSAGDGGPGKSAMDNVRGRPHERDEAESTRSRSKSLPGSGRSVSRERSVVSGGTQTPITAWANSLRPDKERGDESREKKARTSATPERPGLGAARRHENEGGGETKETTVVDKEEEGSNASLDFSVGVNEEDLRGGKISQRNEEDDEEMEEEEKYEDALTSQNEGDAVNTLSDALGLTAATPVSKGTNNTPKSASFAGGTNFIQKKLPGSRVRRTTKSPSDPAVVNPYAKATPALKAPQRIREHTHHTYIRVQINLRGEMDPPSAIVKILAAFLNVLQTKDPSACFTKEMNARRQIHTVADFPPDFRDFYDDWSFWEHDVNYFTLPTPLAGNGRAFHGTMCLSSEWEGDRLLDQCVFAIRSIQSKGGTIKASVKELQLLRTSRNLILFGVPSNVHFGAVSTLLRDMMEDILPAMVESDPVRYPEEEYSWVPQFSVNRMYVKNTPFEERDKSDPTPAWAKLPLHIEVDAYHEDYLEEIFKFLAESRMLHQVLGDYVWMLKNVPPNRASHDDKDTMKQALHTHMTIVLSLGRVFLRGLTDPDTEVELKRGLGENGEQKLPVSMTVRKLMMMTKVNGIRLWQFICPTGDGGWCGYYASGKLCETHRTLADAWSRATAAHVRFKCVSRGIEPGDITRFLRNCFSPSAAREGERARYVNGVIVSEQHASMIEIGQKIKSCKWVNRAAVFDSSERRKGTEKNTKAFLDDDSHAYSFKAQQSVGAATADQSVINPETGEHWKEGERERHFAEATKERAHQASQQVEDDGSIASGESEGWERNTVYQFEGMEQVGKVNESDEGNEMDIDGKEVEETNALSKALREALLGSEGIDPDKDNPLWGGDINHLLRAAIDALKTRTPNISRGSQNQFEESNMVEDRQATQKGAAGGRGP